MYKLNDALYAFKVLGVNFNKFSVEEVLEGN